MRAEQVTDAVAEHGEGPVWDERTGELASVDMLRGDLLLLDRTGRVRRRHVSDVLAALRPRVSGGWVAGIERGFALLDDGDGDDGDGHDGDGGGTHPLGELWDDPDVRMNDGACSPDGAFWCGSMAPEGRAALHRLDVDGTVTTAITGVTVSNGLAWTPDGGRAFYVDSATGGIDELRTRGPDVVERRRFVDVEGTPDGLTLDADGGVWVALYGAAAVHRYDPSGALDAVVDVPASHPTACTFGGPDLDELWITTSAQETGPDGRSGALYRCTPGVRGRLPLGYQG
jgi:sugar lactone lactonase YvrE